MTQPTEQTQVGALRIIGNATQRFISDVLTEKPTTIYRMDDYDAIRNVLFGNVKSAVEKRFPLSNDRYTLSVEDVDYADPVDIDVDEQKRLLLTGRTSSRRLRGSWVLRDAATDKVVSRTPKMTIMRVPRISDRGTFIRNGKEYCIGNILRMEPGVYCRKKPDEVSAQFNIKQGTGQGFSMSMNPKTGVFTIGQATTNAPAYAVLHDMGVTDDQMKSAWGQEIFDVNKAAGSSTRGQAAASKLYSMT